MALAGVEASVDANFPCDPVPCSLPAQNPTQSFWLARTADLDSLGLDAPLPAEADLVVIGSGITGISALYHAVSNGQRGLSIAVVEARSFCSGATGRNGGHCVNYAALAFATIEAAEGREAALAAVELETRCVGQLVDLIDRHGWDCDLVKGGNLQIFASAEEEALTRRHIAAAEAAGVDVRLIEWLSAEELEKVIGATGFYGALRQPGNNLLPRRLVAALYRHALSIAQEKGIEVSLHTQTPVEAVKSGGAGSWLLHSTKGKIKARAVLHATNAYATALLPRLCQAKRTIVPCRAQVIAVRPTVKSQHWTIGFSANEGFDYGFQRPQDQAGKEPLVILGGGRHITSAPHELGVSDDSKLNAAVSTYLRDFLPKHFPDRFPSSWLPWRQKVAVEQEWTGVMGMTQDREPIVGSLRLDGEEVHGQYICAGFGGHGMSRGFSCFLLAQQTSQAFIMQNDSGDVVDLYVPRKCAATNRLITAKDHASVQLNVCDVDEEGRMIPGQAKTYALSGFVRREGQSDDSVNRLATQDGLLKNVWSARQ